MNNQLILNKLFGSLIIRSYVINLLFERYDALRQESRTIKRNFSIRRQTAPLSKNKCVSPALIFFSLLLFAIFIKPNSAYALCDNGRTGPKLGQDYLYIDGGSRVRNEYNAANPSCVGGKQSITVLFNLGAASDPNSEVQGLLTQFRQNNLLPVIRLYTATTSQGFERWAPNDAEKMQIVANAAQNLGAMIRNAGFGSGEVIVYLGNEINNDDEWPTSGSMEERITDFSHVFAQFSANAGSNYRVFLPPLNAYYGSSEGIVGEYQLWVNTLVGGVRRFGGRIDGAALTIYNADPQAIERDYQTMRSYFGEVGVNSFTVSEVGPRIGGRLLDGTADADQWESIMSQVYKAVNNGSILSGAWHINTSFFLNCGGTLGLSSYLVVIHDDGMVHISDKENLPQCDGSGGGGGATECPELSQIGGGSGGAGGGGSTDFFSLLLSLFGIFTPAPRMLNAQVLDVVAQHANGDPTATENQRQSGEVLFGDVSDAVTFRSAARVVVQSNPFLLPFQGLISGKGTIDLTGLLGDIRDMASSETGYDIEDSILGYLSMANRSRYAELLQTLFGQIMAQDQAGIYATSKEILELSGAYELLSLHKVKCENGQMKSRANCDSDAIVDRVLLALAAKYIGTQVAVDAGHKPYSDYIAGYAMPAGNGTATWLVPPVDGASGLPFYASMFACTNPNYVSAFMTMDQVRLVCTEAYGDSIYDGLIDPVSDMGRAIAAAHGASVLNYTLPADDCKYGPACRAYWWLPVVIRDDLQAKIIVDVPADSFSSGAHEEAITTLPGLQSALQVIKKTRNYFKIYKMPEKKVTLATNPCSNLAIGGEIPEAIGGGDITGVEVDLSAEINRALNPNSSPHMTTQQITHNATVDLMIPRDEIEKMVEEGSGPQALYSNFVFMEIVDLFKEKVPDTNITLAELPQRADRQCGGNLVCNTDEVGIPVLGAINLIYNQKVGLLSKAFSPYVPGQSGVNTGRIIKNIAEGNYNKEIAENPWLTLVSLSQQPLSLNL